MAKDPAVIALSYDDYVFKFGRAIIGAARGVVWDNGAAQPDYPGWLAEEATCEIFSGSGDDDIAGSGALTVLVVGQGDDGLEISETVIMTGAVAKDLANDYKIIYRMAVLTTGDDSPVTGSNHGNITVRKKVGPVNMAMITALKGQTYMSIYRIPSNRYGELTDAFFTANEGKGIVIELMRRRNQTTMNGWRGIMSFDLFEGTANQNLKDDPIFLYPGEDVAVIATSAAASAALSGHFSIRLKSLVDGSES